MVIRKTRLKLGLKLGLVLGLVIGCTSALLLGCQPPATSEKQANSQQQQQTVVDDKAGDKQSIACNNDAIVKAFKQQKSDVQVKGCGTIVATLADDTKGSQHQRMIVALEGVTPEHTVLIAHNIDLAPRADSAKKGKQMGFYGEYEYTDKGGVVHWTHHDPAARHQDGWIEVDGQRYQ